MKTEIFKIKGTCFKVLMLIFIFVFLSGCSASKVKVLNAWTGDADNVTKFKTKNVLVIARTAENNARIAFEEKIVEALKLQGIKATESFKKVPKIHPNREMTEERVNLIKSLLASEGYNAIVITAIKDEQKTTTTSNSGIYIGAYGNYYPNYYGSFYDYYAYPYAYGSYYNSFGGYIPTSTATHTSTTYVLETVAYNLDEPVENQLVAVINSNIKDPKKAYEIAETYVAKVMEKLK